MPPNPISYTSSSCTGHRGLRVGAVQGVPELSSLGELRLWGRRKPLYLGPYAAQGLNQHASSPRRILQPFAQTCPQPARRVAVVRLRTGELACKHLRVLQLGYSSGVVVGKKYSYLGCPSSSSNEVRVEGASTRARSSGYHKVHGPRRLTSPSRCMLGCTAVAANFAAGGFLFWRGRRGFACSLILLAAVALADVEAGDRAYSSGAFPQAIAAYRESVERDPTDVEARYKLARAISTLADIMDESEARAGYLEAAEHARAAIAIDPEDTRSPGRTGPGARPIRRTHRPTPGARSG